MAHATAMQDTWAQTVERLGGAERLETEGRSCGAFRRVREIKCAVDFLQIVLAFCLGAEGLRLTAAWAQALGIASLSNVALLKRVRKAVPWLELLVARQLSVLSQGRSPRPVTIAAAHGLSHSTRRRHHDRQEGPRLAHERWPVARACDVQSGRGAVRRLRTHR